MMEYFGEKFKEALTLSYATSIPSILSILLDNEEGISLLTLLGAIIIGAEISPGRNEPMPRIILKSSSKNFEVAIPIENLTSALWVNIQEDAHTLRDKMTYKQKPK